MPSFKSRRFLLSSLMVAMGLTLAACGGDPSAGDKGPADDDGDGE